jgi:hypothetical protein
VAAAKETLPAAMGSVEERRGAVEIEREHAEQANFGFNLDLGDQALQSFHGPPVEVELEVDERRESRWVNHPMGAGQYTVHHICNLFHKSSSLVFLIFTVHGLLIICCNCSDPDPGDTIWNAVPEMSTDDDTDDDGEALYRGQVIDEEKETNCPGR